MNELLCRGLKFVASDLRKSRFLSRNCQMNYCMKLKLNLRLSGGAGRREAGE